MAMDIEQLRKKSVTKDDVTVANASYFFFPLQGLTQRVTLPTDPPAYWSLARDALLRTTILAESMWSSALAIAITKCQSAGYEIESVVGLRARNGHDLMTYVDFGMGWKRFAAKLARDYLLCDNGAFIEVIHAARSPGSKIIGLAHLDSLRCTRTGDPEIPVLYRDRMGKEHEMQAHQVFDVVDLPDPSETLNGVGVCAASRAYKTIYKLAAVESFISEAVSGRSPSKLSFIGGIPQRAVEDAFASAQAEADARGLTSYMGAAVQAALSDKALSLVEIPLREVPTAFNIEQERTDAYLKYANALGIDPQELQPLTGRPLGTATQSQVLDDKQRGKGLSSFFGAFAEMINLRVLPEATTFMFLENDYRDQQAQAQVKLTRAQTRAAQISSGEITPVQALQMAADEGDVPKEFIVEDATDDDRIADDEKPTEEYDDVGAMAEEPQPEEEAAAPEQPQQTVKAARTELVTVAPTIRAKFNPGGESRLVEATKALREYMRTLVEACKEECPKDTGETAESIDYAIKNANTREPVGYLYVGNKGRPEVAIRAGLFGRRGFGPKKAGGKLVFEGKEGETVYATHVNGTEPNDWFKRAWERTAKERADMARRIGALDTEAIDVRDVPLQNAPNVDGYNPDKPDEIPNTRRNRVAGGVIEKEWDESKHPRDDAGRFGEGGGEGDSPKGGRLTDAAVEARSRGFDELAASTGGGVEKRMLIDAKTGEVVDRSTGTQFDAELTPTGTQAMLAGDVVDIHSHPDVTGPSDGDWAQLGWEHVRSVGVLSSSGVEYTIDKTPEWDAMSWQDRSKKVLAETWNRFAEEADYSQDLDAIVHRVNQRMAERFGIKYTTRKRDS